VIAFPIVSDSVIGKQISDAEKRKKRDELLDSYLIDLSDYKFDRDQANDYCLIRPENVEYAQRRV